MKDFVGSVIDELKGKVDYGDVRVVDIEFERVNVKNGIVEAVKRSRSKGFGVRVLINNGWGFSSTSNIGPSQIRKVVRDAISIAKASTLMATKVKFSPTNSIKADYETKYKIDPFDVDLNEKINLLYQIDQKLRKNKEVIIATSNLIFIKEFKYFASTEGSKIKQDILHSGAGIRAMAPSEGELQFRSYGNHAQAGYEYITSLDLLNNSERVREELLMLLTAQPCPSGRRTLILDQNQMALQIHESIGHATELDRVLGTEASYAGTSFLRTSDLNKLKYGSETVNVVSDATSEGGLGSFGFDDEGVEAKRINLIKDGVLVGFQSSRETAPVINRNSSGNMRADGWNRIPLIRMTNINLLPGDIALEQLIGDTKNGIFMSTNRSWSIDDRRLNFQFGCEIAHQIRKGKLTEVYKNPAYTGITPSFWASCNGIANDKSWILIGVPNCGKGEPGQTMRVGHGTSPARFTKVEIGAG